MKKIPVAVLCLFVFSGLQAQYLEWSSLLEESPSSTSRIQEARLSVQDDLFLAGNFSGSLDLDPNGNSSNVVSTPLTSISNLFFARYDDSGESVYGLHVWSKADLGFGGFALDAANGVYLAGDFADSVDLNPGSGLAIYLPSSANARDAFFVKYNHQGVYQWARRLRSTNATNIRSMALGPNGNIILAGTFNGSTDFDPGSGLQNRTAVNRDIFIANYSSSGSYLGAIRMGGVGMNPGRQEVSRVDVDVSGNIYVTGRFEGSVDFDPGGGVNVLTARGLNDFYIARYNSSLQLDWVYQLGSGREEGLIDHKIVGSELWVAGSFRDTIDCNLKSGTSQHLSQGNFDAFFAKYNLSATLQFSKSFGGSGKDEIVSLDFYGGDSLFVSGHFQGTVDFDPSNANKSLTSSSSSSVFFGGYDNQGDLRWVSDVSGTGDVVSTVIRAGNDGNPYLLGNLKGTSDFNRNSSFARNFTGPASFLARYGKCGKMEFNVTTQDAQCGQRDGSAQATVTGGTAPLRYRWTSGSVGLVADSLRAGLYYLTVIDTVNCRYHSDPVLVNETGGPSVNLVTKSDVTCNGGKNGAIVVNVSGGNSPYTYRWSNGIKTQNINGLKAGNYELTVLDANQCKSFLRVKIEEPSPMKIYPVISAPNCGSSDGTLSALVTGGNGPYSYAWQPFGTGNTLFNISSGIYVVTVTDANSCTSVKSIAVSDKNAPDIFLDSVSDISCGSGGGGIFVSISGGNPGYSYLWSPSNQTTQDLTGIQAGQHRLRVTDQSNCRAYFVDDVAAKQMAAPEICIVDVDSVNANAIVVWEKPLSRGAISHYNVYRETSTLNVFDLVQDSIEYTELSLFEDRFADTWTRPWSYKLSMTDTCGVESKLSSAHTTIHNVISKNAQQDFNILWTPYEGNFPVLQYALYRYTDTTGTVDSITSLPANVFSYTDQNSPSKGSDVYYFVKVVHPSGCTATDAQNRNSSRSNRGSTAPPPEWLGKEKRKEVRTDFKLYPNPNNGAFALELDASRSSSAMLRLYDMHGRLVFEQRFAVAQGLSRQSIQAGNLQEGLHLVRLEIDGQVQTTKLLISNR